jgi:hypothetical protein
MSVGCPGTARAYSPPNSQRETRGPPEASQA